MYKYDYLICCLKNNEQIIIIFGKENFLITVFLSQISSYLYYFLDINYTGKLWNNSFSSFKTRIVLNYIVQE